MNRVWISPPCIEMTGAEDGLSHLVRQSDYDDGLTSSRGAYKTLCGTVILATSLVSAPGARCRTCLRAT